MRAQSTPPTIRVNKSKDRWSKTAFYISALISGYLPRVSRLGIVSLSLTILMHRDLSWAFLLELLCQQLEDKGSSLSKDDILFPEQWSYSFFLDEFLMALVSKTIPLHLGKAFGQFLLSLFHIPEHWKFNLFIPNPKILGYYSRLLIKESMYNVKKYNICKGPFSSEFI